MQLNKHDLVLVTGAGGFIGGHLVNTLLKRGFTNLRAVDIKPTDCWCQLFDGVQVIQADLRLFPQCQRVCKDARYVFNLAADMGGMGFIETHKADCMLSVLINTHLLLAAKEFCVERFFYSSSACVYAANRQVSSNVVALKESDAYPAMPEDGYGWEKLFSERMCHHFLQDFGLLTRVARYHNVYGPCGTYDGGREKAPAALCRKIAVAKLSGDQELTIWGDGQQTRSFMYIDDCLYGTLAIMESDTLSEPVNLGSSELVSINQLVDTIEDIAGVKLKRHYNLDAPKGVRGRNSNNELIQRKLNWQPSVKLREGLEKTYHWIYNQVKVTNLV